MSLHVITGPMRAGKTAELIRRVRQAQAEGRETRVFVHELGAERDGEQLRSRNGASIPATPVASADDIFTALAQSRDGTLVVIDEAQFFDPADMRQLVPSVLSWGFTIIVAGLDTDFRAMLFPAMTCALAMADSVSLLEATCARCGAPATRTQRLIDGKPAPWDSPVIMPGGEDMYEPRCVECHEVPGRPGVSGRG